MTQKKLTYIAVDSNPKTQTISVRDSKNNESIVMPLAQALVVANLIHQSAERLLGRHVHFGVHSADCEESYNKPYTFAVPTEDADV